MTKICESLNIHYLVDYSWSITCNGESLGKNAMSQGGGGGRGCFLYKLASLEQMFSQYEKRNWPWERSLWHSFYFSHRGLYWWPEQIQFHLRIVSGKGLNLFHFTHHMIISGHFLRSLRSSSEDHFMRALRSAHFLRTLRGSKDLQRILRRSALQPNNPHDDDEEFPRGLRTTAHFLRSLRSPEADLGSHFLRSLR